MRQTVARRADRGGAEPAGGGGLLTFSQNRPDACCGGDKEIPASKVRYRILARIIAPPGYPCVTSSPARATDRNRYPVSR